MHERSTPPAWLAARRILPDPGLWYMRRQVKSPDRQISLQVLDSVVQHALHVAGMGVITLAQVR